MAIFDFQRLKTGSEVAKCQVIRLFNDKRRKYHILKLPFSLMILSKNHKNIFTCWFTSRSSRTSSFTF